MARKRRTATLALAVCALTAFGPAVAGTPAVAAPASAGARIVQVEMQLSALYQQAEAANARYDTATEAVRTGALQLAALAEAIYAAQDKAAVLKSLLGQVAAAAYRGGGLPPSVQLLFSSDPQGYLDNIPLIDLATGSVTRLVAEYRSTEATLSEYGTLAARSVQGLTAEQAAAAAAQQQIQDRLASATSLLAALQASQLAELQQMQAANAFSAQLRWRAQFSSAELARPGSARSSAVMAFAVAQIGRPYVWGGTGPDGFDCSGLVMRAWQAAGRSIPRTSEEQWAELPHVPISQIRPGDLIVYFHDASHVALYVGDGAIIQAPHPGGQVELSAVGSMPILGVVRPG